MPRFTLVLCCVLALGGALYASASETTPSAPTAELPQAPAPEPNFIDTLAWHGMRFESPESATGVGRAVCDALEHHVSPSRISDILVRTLSITRTEAHLFVLTAVDAFCRQFAGSGR